MDILLFLLQAIATVTAANSASGYWGADNRVVPATYNGNGRFYQREVVHEPEYYYPDEDYSNQIGRYPVPEAPVYHPSTRHRNHHNTNPYVSPNWRRRVHAGSGHGRNTHHQYYQDVSSQNHRGSHQKGAHHQSSAAAPSKSQHVPRITTGLYRSSQWGSATIPYKGAKVHVPVLSGSKKAYRGTITTTVFSPQQASSGAAQNSLQPQTSATRVDPGIKEVHDAPDLSSQKLCVRCPGDRAVVAAKGTSFVLVETPAVKPCHNSAVTRAKLSEIRVESLFGPQPGTTVQEGSYSMLIRLIHHHEQLQMCKYRITVIVRKCSPLHLAPHLRVQCSLNNVWGSKCSFACHQGYQLLGSNSTECGDRLKWTNSPPRCVAVRACPLPMSPEHGHLSCETPGNAVSRKTDLLEEGSICRYECDTGYTIPGFQSHLSSIKCWAGSWNSTVDPSCQAQSAAQTTAVSYGTQADAGQRRRSIRHKHHRLRASCKNNPCQGGGTCFNGPHPNRPTLCICPPNREGDFCERAKCEEELCKNGGRCVVMGNSSFCYCPPGFTGPTCQQPMEHSNATQHADSNE